MPKNMGFHATFRHILPHFATKSIANPLQETLKIMASINLYLRTTKLKRDVGSVLFVIRHKNQQVQVVTGIELPAECWDKSTQTVIGCKNAKQLNMTLKNKLYELQMRLAELSTFGELGGMTVSDIRKRLWPDVKERPRKTLVSVFYESFIAMKEKKATRESYELTRRKVSKYCDWKALEFSHITYKWLTEFESNLRRDGNSVNTISIHMRNIRSIYNEAIRQDVVSQEGYPFRKYRIKHEDTAKRSLDVEQLRELRDYPCEEFMRKYVDVFFISFYLAGINMVDLLELPPLKKGNVIEYRRSKTGILCKLTVPDEALALINKYKGESHLLVFGEMYKNRKDFIHRLNDNLQKVGDLYYTHMTTKNGARHKVKNYRPLFPGLTSYWARHTWATIAADIDIPDAVIDAALGHKSPYPMTDIYIRRNAKKVDEAVRKVIDYVNG